MAKKAEEIDKLTVSKKPPKSEEAKPIKINLHSDIYFIDIRNRIHKADDNLFQQLWQLLMHDEKHPETGRNVDNNENKDYRAQLGFHLSTLYADYKPWLIDEEDDKVAEIIVYLKAKAKKQLDPAVYGQIRAYLHNKENPLAKVAKAFPAPEYELIEKQIEKANEKEIKNVLRVILLKTNVLEREGSQVVGQFFKEKDKEDKVKEGEYDQTSRD